MGRSNKYETSKINVNYRIFINLAGLLSGITCHDHKLSEDLLNSFCLTSIVTYLHLGIFVLHIKFSMIMMTMMIMITVHNHIVLISGVSHSKKQARK